MDSASITTITQSLVVTPSTDTLLEGWAFNLTATNRRIGSDETTQVTLILDARELREFATALLKLIA